MSKLYGKRRVVLATKPNYRGNYVVSRQGGKSYLPLGIWYERGGLYFADLQGYGEVGGCGSRLALRDRVADYLREKGQL